MNPDNFQEAWRAQTSHSRLSIDPDVLLQEVQRNQRQFAATIFWRDVREVGIALLMIPLWVFLGIRLSLPWAWYLTVPALVTHPIPQHEAGNPRQRWHGQIPCPGQ